jgi:hypothetical protein
MRLNLLALLISLAFAATSRGAEPIRDPWAGFGLDSTVQLHHRVEIGGKTVRDEHKTCRVQKVSTDGSAGIAEAVVIDGKEELSMMHHVLGGDPEDMGLVLESEKDSKLTIAGKEYPVKIRHWKSAKDKKELEKAAKPFPEILKQRGLRGVDNVEISLTFYEATSPDVDIPYHEIETPGLDISVGPRVVKAEFRFQQLDKDGKPEMESTFTETATGLKVPFKAKEKTADCVVFKIEMSQSSKDQAKPMLGSGEHWYSNSVPGRVVKQTLTGESPEGKAASTLVVESFEVRPPLPKFDLAKIAADETRAVIPDPEWRKMRVGAWRVGVTQIMERGARQPSHFDISLVQVVQALDKNRYIKLSKKLTDKGWEDEGYEIVDRSLAEKKEVKTDRDEIKLLDETVACERRTTTITDRWGSSTKIEWEPLDDKWKKVLADAGLKYAQRIEDQVSKDSFSEHKRKIEAVIMATDAKTSVGGKELACVQMREKTWEEGALTHVEHSFHSQLAPDDSTGSINVSKRDFFFHHLLDFGEADKPFPTVEQLRDQFREAAKLVRSVDLNAVK